MMSAMATITIVGGADDFMYAFFVLLVDLAEASKAAEFLHTLRRIHDDTGRFESPVLHEIFCTQAKWIVVSELGEIVIPCVYLLAWLLMYAGPNSAAYAGIGATAFGTEPPSSLS